MKTPILVFHFQYLPKHFPKQNALDLQRGCTRNLDSMVVLGSFARMLKFGKLEALLLQLQDRGVVHHV
jgi:hypothetical protein